MSIEAAVTTPGPLSCCIPCPGGSLHTGLEDWDKAASIPPYCAVPLDRVPPCLTPCCQVPWCHPTVLVTLLSPHSTSSPGATMLPAVPGTLFFLLPLQVQPTPALLGSSQVPHCPVRGHWEGGAVENPPSGMADEWESTMGGCMENPARVGEGIRGSQLKGVYGRIPAGMEGAQRHPQMRVA